MIDCLKVLEKIHVPSFVFKNEKAYLDYSSTYVERWTDVPIEELRNIEVECTSIYLDEDLVIRYPVEFNFLHSGVFLLQNKEVTDVWFNKVRRLIKEDITNYVKSSQDVFIVKEAIRDILSDYKKTSTISEFFGDDSLNSITVNTAYNYPKDSKPLINPYKVSWMIVMHHYFNSVVRTCNEMISFLDRMKDELFITPNDAPNLDTGSSSKTEMSTNEVVWQHYQRDFKTRKEKLVNGLKSYMEPDDIQKFLSILGGDFTDERITWKGKGSELHAFLQGIGQNAKFRPNRSKKSKHHFSFFKSNFCFKGDGKWRYLDEKGFNLSKYKSEAHTPETQDLYILGSTLV